MLKDFLLVLFLSHIDVFSCSSWDFQCVYIYIWRFPLETMIVGFSLINQPFGGYPIYGNPHIYIHILSISIYLDGTISNKVDSGQLGVNDYKFTDLRNTI